MSSEQNNMSFDPVSFISEAEESFLQNVIDVSDNIIVLAAGVLLALTTLLSVTNILRIKKHGTDSDTSFRFTMIALMFGTSIATIIEFFTSLKIFDTPLNDIFDNAINIFALCLPYQGYMLIHSMQPRQTIASDHDADQLEETRTEAIHQHDAILIAIYDAETDWDTIFHLPALQDVSVPETAALHRAVATAQQLRERLPENPLDDPQLTGTAYPRAVRDLDEAFTEAMKAAAQIGQYKLTPADRAIIARIKQYLHLMEDSAARPSERSMARQQIRKLIEKLTSITIPPAQMHQLEHTAQQMLET